MNTYQSYARTCVEHLQQWYNWTTGLWTSTGWWNAANCLEALIDYSRITKTTIYHNVITNTFTKNESGQFLNQYYDDEQWWALTWIKAELKPVTFSTISTILGGRHTFVCLVYRWHCLFDAIPILV
jgi:hypothetical protein